jgi:hypothetical protein
MRFRLMYRGKLKSNGSKQDKHDIRRQLAPQIHDLSHREPLSSWGACFGSEAVPCWPYAPHDVGGVKFIPIIFSGLHLIARLDILFLRPEDPGKVVTQGGDLDNRIKTLFDGLRVPKLGELPQKIDGSTSPLWCLLEDDALVMEFSMRTDRLLGVESDDVLLIVTVTVGASQHVIKNTGLASF